MTSITIRALPYTIPADNEGQTIEITPNCEVKLGCCSVENAITKITEKFKTRGSAFRTIENNLRQDITGKYREWVIEFKYFDNDSFNEVRNLYKKQCDDFHCIQMRVENRCDNTGCDCCDDTNGWVKVYVELGDKVYTENTYELKGFKLKLTESAGDRCANC